MITLFYWVTANALHFSLPYHSRCIIATTKDTHGSATSTIVFGIPDSKYFISYPHGFLGVKSTSNKCWRGCGEKGTLLHCWWECKLVQPLWRTVWRFLKKLQIELPYDPAIPLLGIHTEETRIEGDMCTPMFIAALFIIAGTWNQPRCPISRWMDKKAVVHIHNGVLLSH